MRPTAALTLAMQARGLSVAETAALLEIGPEYLEAILAKRVRLKGYVAVRLEAHFSELSAQKLLLDQAFVELHRARMQYEAAQKEVAL